MMANHRSSKKRIIRNSNRALINGARVSRIRTFVKKVENAIASGSNRIFNFFHKSSDTAHTGTIDKCAI